MEALFGVLEGKKQEYDCSLWHNIKIKIYREWEHKRTQKPVRKRPELTIPTAYDSFALDSIIDISVVFTSSHLAVEMASSARFLFGEVGT